MNTPAEQPQLVICGAGGHARVVADIVRQQGQYRLAGFLDDTQPERRGATFCGAAILGGDEQWDALLAQGIRHVLVGFGHNLRRLALAERLLTRGFTLATAIHPRATVAPDVVVGEGTIIAAGAVVNPAARIGRAVIINTSASVDHECDIGPGAHICPGVHLAGQVTVGPATQIGIGATVIQGIRIGSRVVVGAGSVVVRDLPDGVVAFGVPAAVKGEAGA